LLILRLYFRGAPAAAATPLLIAASAFCANCVSQMRIMFRFRSNPRGIAAASATDGSLHQSTIDCFYQSILNNQLGTGVFLL
jgi:hypothetical protein